MRIAVCDDEREQRDEISRYIRNCGGGYGIVFYDSALNLLNAYGKGARYDLVFLDIRMKGLNGFEAARKLRTEFPREKPRIVFVTITREYAVNYEIIWDYIQKPPDEKEVKRVVLRAESELAAQTRFFPSKGGGAIIAYCDIRYFEASGRYSDVFMTNGTTHNILSPISELPSVLPERLFFQTHRCYIVNLSNVVRYDKTSVFFEGCGKDKKASLSRNNRQAFVNAMNDYLRSHV
jgi:DNA-binding LytR/AlgR family response regulator